MSENHKIFFDSDGKPVARLSSNMLEFKHADLPELEAFFKGKLPQKPSTPTAKEMDTIEKAAAEAAIKDSKNNEAGQAQNEESLTATLSIKTINIADPKEATNGGGEGEN